MHEARPTSSAASAGRRRLLAFLVVVGMGFVLALTTGVLPSADQVRAWGESFGALGPLAYVPFAAALSCAFVPGPVLAGTAGVLFGTVVGTPTALASAVLAACAQLLIGRRLAGERAADLLPERVRRLDDFIERRGLVAVLYLRLTPLVPYTLTNYGAGLTRLRARDMAGGTALGALPRTFLYVAVGGTITDLGSPEALAALVLAAVLALAGVVLARRQIARERAGDGSPVLEK